MGDFNDALMRNQNASAQARAKQQNRATINHTKMIGHFHPTGLTPNLLKLFEPRPPLEYKPPLEKITSLPFTGIVQFVTAFAKLGDPEYAPVVEKAETKAQKRARIHKLRLEKGAKKAAEELEKYDLSKGQNITGDPYKTLFVAGLNYETTEHKLQREFERYGVIKKVEMITDKQTNKPRGYAFIEYIHTRDMKAAYKQANGRKLDNRRVLVDVERGRTVPNWQPRRLGGGLGSTRLGSLEVNYKYCGREPQQTTSVRRSRSGEPRAREDRRIDREREKSREPSHDRTREREPREERHHHRDRDRTRDGDRDMDRGRDYDRAHERDRGRESRDHDRGRERDHLRERDCSRGHGRGHENERHYGERIPESEREHGQYNHLEPVGDHDMQCDHGRHEQMKADGFRYDRMVSEPQEPCKRERTRDDELGYQRSERSLLGDYEH